MAILSKGGSGGESGGGGAEAAGGPDPADIRTNLPPRTGPICGRKPEMQSIVDVFSRSSQGERAGRIEIWGAPGSGATSVALELARRAGGRFPGGAWWIRLDLGADLAWADLAVTRSKTARVKDLRAVASAERERFGKEPRSLLVIDGVPSPDALREALPPEGDGAADVFAVSEKPTGVFDSVVEVGGVPAHAPRRIAHAVLRIRDGEKATPPAVRTLDGLALTASLAARAAVAYDGQAGPISVDDPTSAVMRLMPLVAQNPASVEALLLCSMAHSSLLSVDAIMGAVAKLREGRGKAPEPSEMGEAILRLVRLGLLSLDEESRVSMHPVVQTVVRAMAKTDEDRRVTREALANGLCPRGRGGPSAATTTTAWICAARRCTSCARWPPTARGPRGSVSTP